MKQKWKLVYKGKLEDFDPLISLEYWRNKSTEEKFLEVSNLIKQVQYIKGIKFNGREFLRSTAVIKRT